MKKLILLLTLTFASQYALAQVPLFGSSIGKDKIYTFQQIDFQPGTSSSSSYFNMTVYGITNNLTAGIDILGTTGSLSQSFLLKYTFLHHKNINIALQTGAWFNYNQGYAFERQYISLYLNGNIYKGLNYVSNTNVNVSRAGDVNTQQLWYLNYNYKFFGSYLGMSHKWADGFDPNLTVGLSFNVQRFNLYLWGIELISNRPRFVIGFDYCFPLRKNS